MTWSGSYWNQAQASLWSGVDTTTPQDVATTSAVTAASTAHAAAALTTAHAGCGLLFGEANENSATSTPPTGYTEQQEANYLKTNTKIAGSAGSETISGGSLSTSTVKVGLLTALRPASSGTSLDLGLATETDTAQAAGFTKTPVFALGTETDTARAASLTKAAVLAGATETDTAQAFSLAKTAGLAAATETDAAHAMTWSKGWPLAAASELNAARAMTLDTTSGVALPLSTATETDAARPVTLTKALQVPAAAESDSARAATLTKAPALAKATETDTAHAMTFSKGWVYARASETGSVWAISFNELLRNITVVARLRGNRIAGRVAPSSVVARVRPNRIIGGVTVPRSLVTGSTEYVTAEVIFEDLTLADILSVTGQVAITSDDVVPTSFLNPDLTTRELVVDGAMLSLSKLHTAGAPGTYRVWVKVTDSPEIPIMKCGSFTVR